MFGCRHKWHMVDMLGYQHCKKCGLARNVGVPCNHKWIQCEFANIVDEGTTISRIYVLRCDKCGEMKNHTAGLC